MARKYYIGIIIILVLLATGLFFVKRNRPEKLDPVACTQEAKLCPDGSYVGRTGSLCEFAVCPESAASLPKGYNLDSYTIEKVLDVACVKNSDCQTPVEYQMISRCPMTSLCLQNKCNVVCPGH